MCGIYLRPLLRGAATFPLPPPMICVPAPAATTFQASAGTTTAACLIALLRPAVVSFCGGIAIKAKIFVQSYKSLYKQGRNAAFERNIIFILLRSCLFGCVLGPFVLSAKGNSHFYRACLLCVLIGPFHTVADVLF